MGRGADNTKSAISASAGLRSAQTGVSVEPEQMVQPVLTHHDNNIDMYVDPVSGQISRLDGPALVVHFRDGGVQSESWRFKGIDHREDGGPSMTMFNTDGIIIHKEYRQHGKLFRADGGPVELDFYSSGLIKHEKYVDHNGNYTKVVSYTEDGTIIE